MLIVYFTAFIIEDIFFFFLTFAFMVLNLYDCMGVNGYVSLIHVVTDFPHDIITFKMFIYRSWNFVTSLFNPQCRI